MTDTSAATSFQQILTPGTFFFLFPRGSYSNNHTLDTKLYLARFCVLLVISITIFRIVCHHQIVLYFTFLIMYLFLCYVHW